MIAQKGKVDQARFALESSKDVLAEYNDYFGVKYPLPKLDNIAAPGRSQFFSAMENWGAIFTFEHTLLLDPAIANVSDRQRIFSVAAHEIAHQWFGNLVTMAWWDDLWLNEGFATWMAARTTQKLHPEWNTAPIAVFHADLPRLGAEDVAALLAAGERGGCAIAPDRHGTGTNALAIGDGRAFSFAFGADSFARHRAQAGERFEIVTRPGLALDVDTPDDLRIASRAS